MTEQVAVQIIDAVERKTVAVSLRRPLLLGSLLGIVLCLPIVTV
ncbi:hypothetical protein Xcel_1521 [Xylanimonas cellulosilytica DSM 15894]|uniref:Uncharacterized protein n=1 Tax=Xylanimonas cellulosilytica (strain DSM 15894 / JCM 12276 / CECT 5975 / KCTC 9989 / LMG 20990 / NBRC 107835 / XIL07) TaxID=446471 RepID=D1BS59_XYLCX|nr:hypothetical protein [Xylanimonas cellulosilytica]ACZ30551.1 hypothetical protein Xcel_1521 [Xylanimonas cellulosilytica DSM 15894]